MIKSSLIMSLSKVMEVNEMKLSNILQALLDKRMKAWALVKDDKHVVGIITTTITQDTMVGVRNLFLYSLAASEYIPRRGWAAMFALAKRIAKAEECSSMIGFSKEPFVLKMVEGLGGTTDTRMITLEVD